MLKGFACWLYFWGAAWSFDVLNNESGAAERSSWAKAALGIGWPIVVPLALGLGWYVDRQERKSH